MAKYWIGKNQEEEEEEEEDAEALSLCDLPDNLIKIEENEFQRESESDGGRQDGEFGVQGGSCDDNKQQHKEKEEPEFDFGWWGNNQASISSESHMCAADELFFKGQILPRRLSLSSDNGLVCRSMSRSESMDNGSVNKFIGSRSSSIGSYRSSSTSTSSTNSSFFAANRSHEHHKPPSKNNYYLTHTNLKPQSLNDPAGQPYRQPSLRASHSHSNNKFSLWDFFRTGLVRAPATDIELRDLKFRGRSNSKRKSGISRNSSSNKSNPKTNSKKNNEQTGSLFDRNVIAGFLGANCKCSVETVPLNVATTKAELVLFPNRRPSSAARDGSGNMNATTTTKRKIKIEQKQAMSRQRTNEWLKELSLSHAATNLA